MDTDQNEGVLQPIRLSVVRNLFKTPTYGDSGVQVNYDRFIPTRANNTWHTSFANIPDPPRATTSGKKTRDSGESPRDTSAYTCLLRNELLGENIEDIKTQCDERQALTPLKSKNLFKYGTPKVSF